MAIDKKCSRCGVSKPISEYYIRGRGSYSCWCKNCCKDVSRQQDQSGRKRTDAEKEARRKREGATKNRRYKLTKIQKFAQEMYSNLKRRELRHGRILQLTPSDVEQLIVEFCSQNYYQIIEKEKSPFQPSLDRIDNSKGYEIGNVKVVWLIENYAKNTFTEDALIEFCKRKLMLPVE